jgi:hypothetical protein
MGQHEFLIVIDLLYWWEPKEKKRKKTL